MVRVSEILELGASEPIVGRRYWVPTMRARYHDRFDDWPVIGPKHEDHDHFNFPQPHYHVDLRFLTWAQIRGVVSWRGPGVEGKFATILGTPLIARAAPGVPTPPELPPPVRTALRCARTQPAYAHGDKEAVHKLRNTYAGQRCKRGRDGFICPHRHAPLGSLPVIDGVITCPLHGLRIEAATGLVLPHVEENR